MSVDRGVARALNVTAASPQEDQNFAVAFAARAASDFERIWGCSWPEQRKALAGWHSVTAAAKHLAPRTPHFQAHVFLHVSMQQAEKHMY